MTPRCCGLAVGVLALWVSGCIVNGSHRREAVPDAMPGDGLGGIDTQAQQACPYTQDLVYVDPGVDASQPCGPGDGTCISGTLTFQGLVVESTDIGEVYLFGDKTAPPILEYRETGPSSPMRFKIPNIAKEITDACVLFLLGARLDRGGDNQGTSAGPEDVFLPMQDRPLVDLTAGKQTNGIALVLHQ